MTDTVQNVQGPDLEQYTDISQLRHFWAEDGLPIFVADVDHILEIVQHLGFSIFYVLGNITETVGGSTSTNTSGTTTTNTYSPPKTVTRNQLFKVVNNIIGQTISSVKNVAIDTLDSLKESAYYSMPAIPRVMIEKLDEFFRTVDAAHGTEAIVLLTFDTTKEDSSGWGILVPDQQNTAAHCNYDPLSVVESKPDHVLIVGSVHSHPQMAAYASGTDHKDQADFDGLHITFGWQDTVNNGATQYHIEMQMSGSTYTLRAKDVFEPYSISTEPDPEVLEWTTKVKKALPPSTWGGTHTAPLHQATQLHQSSKKTTATQKDFTPSSSPLKDKDISQKYYYEIKPELSLDSVGIVVAELSSYYSGSGTDYFCPCCEVIVDHDDIWAGNCWSCDIPICAQNETIANIHDIVHNYCFTRNIAKRDYAIYLWAVNPHDNSDFFISIQSAPDSSSGSVLSINYSQETTYDKYLDFESDTRHVNVYNPDSICTSCQHFYAYSCPLYKDLAINYNPSADLNMEKYENAINPDDCSYFEYYAPSEYDAYEEIR